MIKSFLLLMNKVKQYKKLSRNSYFTTMAGYFVVLGFFTASLCYADTTPPTVSILSPADGKKLYSTVDAAYPIKVVFSAWDKNDGVRTAGSNSFVLKWWKGASSGVFDITTSLSQWGPIDTAYEVHRSYDWQPSDGAGSYTLQVQAIDNATNVGMSRKVDVNVGITTLNSYSGFPGDGKLLVRDNDNTICMSCHELKSHSSANVNSTKYGNWERVCRDCHTPHNTKNIFLLQSSFKIYTGVNHSHGYNKKVDFRNISGESTYGFVTKTGNTRRGPCEVCHTKTSNTDSSPRWRNYTSEPDADGLKHNAGKACIDCHYHTDGFKPGESQGNFACNGCHADIYNPMNRADDGYHHYLNNAQVSDLASGSKYPVIDPPSPMGGQDDPNRRCLQCHLDHDLFKPELNPDSPSRAHNLRPNIATLPTTTSGQNTDFVESDPYGGICLSCHQNSQTKSYTQPDGTVVTPVINKEMFIDSPHNYQAPVTFNSGATVFQANCSKCHIDTLNKTKQGAGTQVGPHYSQIRRINAASINENNLGIATGGSTSTLSDNTKNWATDIWSGWPVTILAGTGAAQTFTVSSNDATTITISGSFSPAPSTDSTYLLSVSRGIYSDTSTGGNSESTLIDTNASWITNYWKDRPVTITRGTGYAQTSRVVSNTATTLTLYTSFKWSVIPDSTSVYSLGDPSEEEVCFRCHSRQRNPNAASGQEYFGVYSFNNKKVLRMEELFNDPAKPYKHRIDKYFARHRGDESETAPVNATASGWFNDVSGGTHTGCQDCHNPHGNRHPGEDSGMAESGNNTSMTDNDKNWSQDQWRGYVLRIMDGTGRGQDRLIVKNDGTTLTLAADYVTAPGSDSFYIIQPFGLPEKGNNLWYPNHGTWGVQTNYTTAPIGTMNNPVFTKDAYLEGGVNKIYELCLKCHSDYAWGTSGTPFDIADSIINTSGTLGEGSSTNIAQEFNPNNVGFHPVVGIGKNQPISPTGFGTVDFEGPFLATGGSTSSIAYTNTWNPNKYNGYCAEITAGTGAGQVRTITAHDSTGITRVDPYFSAAPVAGSEIYIRKCSSYNVNDWPRFTLGTLDITNGSATVTITGLSDGIPSTVIRGWYLYAGTLTGTSPSQAPPNYATSGWFQIKEVSAGASDAITPTVTLTVDPVPTANYNGSYALSAGLGNSFVPPYGPWSTMGCADCHDTDDPRDPSGPHASSRTWMMRTLEAQIFPWYYGGLSGEGTSSTEDVSAIKMIGYPSGGDSENNYNGWGFADANKYICFNCHRADGYKIPTDLTWPSGSAFVDFTERTLGRITHVPHVTGGYFGRNKYGIMCMNCHIGDNRTQSFSGAQSPYKALGGAHGSNQGIGDKSGVAVGTSFRGRRLLNGTVWMGVTRAYTNSGVRCFSGGQDGSVTSGSVASCIRNYDGGWVGNSARYAYFSGPDSTLPELTDALANDASGGHTGVQNGDQVILTFNGETASTPIDSDNIESALILNNGHSWGAIVSAVWSTATYTNDTLTVTLDSDATIEVGDSITSDGIIMSGVNSQLRGTVTLGGDFGFSIESAFASDASGGGYGIQAGDTVVLKFSEATAGTVINSVNIDTALALSGGHTWLDGFGNVSTAWTTDIYTYDTLTITLGTTTSVPTVSPRDTITLNGTILNAALNPITNAPVLIRGTFDSMLAGTVAFWSLDETSGPIAHDDSGNGNDGVVSGTANWTTGKKGGALTFDGSTNYAYVEDDPVLDLTSAGTIELWAKKDLNAYSQTYIYKGSAYRVYERLTTGELAFTWNGTTLITTNQLAAGAWNHIVCTCNGSVRNIYINGELANTGTCASQGPTADPLYIGSWNGDSNFYDGQIDNVTLYNRALTPTEVRERFNKLNSAVANDNSGSGEGIQGTDEVVIYFNQATAGQAGSPINAGNIDAALALSDGHSWLDGSNAIGSAVWSTTNYTDDTLTITLSTATSTPTIGVGDVITVDGTIKDASGKPFAASIQISGSFGALAGIPDGLVGYWSLDEGSGSTVGDSTYYNNSGTTVDSPAWTTGRFGNAIDLVPTSQYVNINDANPLDLTQAATIELWAKKNSNRSFQPYISKGSGTSEMLIDEDGTTGEVRFRWGNITIQTAAEVSAGTWHHIVGTYDGATMTLYVDGQVEGSPVDVSFIFESNTSPLLIGRNSSGNSFDGAIDDVALYNRALTPAEITARYGANLVSAFASDPLSSGRGIQAGDQVIIKFNGPTNGDEINAGNIDSALGLGGNTWLDGFGNVSTAWSTVDDVNDTLTVTLSDTSGAPTVSIGDTLTLDGTIKDSSGRPIVGAVIIAGTFNVIPANAVGYWNLDEGGGITAYDATGNGNDGALTGSPPWIVGRYGNALDMVPFDYVIIPDAPVLDLTSAGTIEFWARKDSNRNYGTYVVKGSAFRVLDYATQGKLAVRWGNTSNTIISDTVFATNVWRHIVVTYNGSLLSLYVDGELNSQVPWSTDAVANTDSLQFGGLGTNTLDGQLDELLIYNVALDAAQVKARYGTHPKSAVANDASTLGAGIQANDQIVISFNDSTNGDLIDSGNIATALVLNSGSWGSTNATLWSNDGGNTNDTLTITLTADATVGIGDTIALGGVIKDTSGVGIDGSIAITGSFGSIVGMPDGAVAYWKMDEGSGTGLSDESPHNNTLSAVGSPLWTTGRFGSALDFVPNDYAWRTDSNSLDLSKAATIEVWARKDINKSNQVYVSKGNVISDSTSEYRLYENGTSGEVIFKWGLGSVSTSSAVLTETWNHIVGTYDGANLNIYVNGALSNTAAYETDILPPTVANFLLARASNGNNFDGIIDNVAIYNRALTLSEIQDRFIVSIASITGVDATYGGIGVQPDDKAVIKFNGATNGDTINAGNINTALALNNGHTWFDGLSSIGYANWSTTTYINDTLVIELSGGDSQIPTVAGGDTVTLGTVIRDPQLRTVTGSAVIDGDFDVPGGSVGVWWYDTGSGTTAYDATSANNHGTITGAGWITGRFGNALNYDGSSHYVTYAASTDLSLSGSYTIEAWIKPTAYNTDGPIIANNSDSFRYALSLNSTGKLCFSYNNSGSIVGRDNDCSDSTVPLNEWTHIALIRNGGSGSTATFYINGQASGTIANENHYSSGAGALLTGKTTFDFDYFYAGAIDDLVIYNKALSAEELKRRYRTWATHAGANNNSGGGHGVQADDQVVIIFDGETNGPTIDSSTIETALALNNGHSWLDGSNSLGGTGEGVWDSTTYTNDTLTITLSDATSVPTIMTGDVITMGDYIKDNLLRPLTGTIVLTGAFSPVPADAVAYYELDEVSGTFIVDGSDWHNDGKIYGNATRTTGKVDSAISFDGVDDYIEIANTSFNLSTSVSVEFWIKATVPVNGDGLVVGDAFVVKAWSGELNAGVTTDTGWQGSGWIAGGNSVNLYDNTWHHVVLTWDGSTQRLYADGVLDPDTKAGTGVSLVGQNTVRFGNQLTGDFWFTGAIDEVVIYNKALSQAEVTNRFTNP